MPSATHPTPPSALEQVRAFYCLLDERAQLSVLCDLIQGGNGNLDRSDAFIDALQPVDGAFDEAWTDLENAADDAAFDQRVAGVTAALSGAFR